MAVSSRMHAPVYECARFLLLSCQSCCPNQQRCAIRHPAAPLLVGPQCSAMNHQQSRPVRDMYCWALEWLTWRPPAACRCPSAGRRSCLWYGRLAGPLPPGPAFSHTSPSLQPRQASGSHIRPPSQHIPHVLIACSGASKCSCASLQAWPLAASNAVWSTLFLHCSMSKTNPVYSLPAPSGGRIVLQ